MREAPQLFIPEVGKTYRNAGGGRYRCLSAGLDENRPLMQNVASGWTFQAHGLVMYADGSIEWDYSTSGYFPEWGL